MNKRLMSRFLFSSLVALLFLSGLSMPVLARPLAAEAVKTQTIITLSKLSDTRMGENFTIEGVIKDAGGHALADRSIQFSLDGEYLGQAHSDAAGLFKRSFSKDLSAGSYSIVSSWSGSHELTPGSATQVLQIMPALVHVQAFPAIAGIPFSLGGQRVVSDADGLATFSIGKAGDYRLEALVDQYQNPELKIEFGRWLSESYEPYTFVKVPSKKVIQVGFNVFRPVGQSFIDLDGFQVDPARITEFMIRSAQGDVFIFHDGQQRWIPASRIARRVTGLEETRLLYSVISVTVDGSNVVNQSQQRFYTFPNENWPISLLLYSLRITAKDGMFGVPVGSSVNLEYPDGKIVNYPLEQDGTVIIHSLARGNYFTEIVGVFGLSNRLPVSLSRNQDVVTKVITYLDLALIGLLAGLLALGLLLIGRPSLLYIFRPARAHEKALENGASGPFAAYDAETGKDGYSVDGTGSDTPVYPPAHTSGSANNRTTRA